ncbi:MAG: NAD-dependent epimerase/dehydratase family protein [Chloroflexota bacterium]
MRIAVLGGTGFLGRAIVADLEAAGHTVLVIHRGQHELQTAADTLHAHLDRHDVHALAAALDSFGPDALIDGFALTARDADDALLAVPGALRMLAVSSMDVYRAFAALHANSESDPCPLDESSPLRTERYPYRGKIPKLDDYDKLDVEDRYLWRGATIVRLPMIYGEFDPQRREEPVLRRIRAGRTRLPVGVGNWLWTRGSVGEMARGIRLALESDAAAGQILNLGERRTGTMRAWIEAIVAATGSDMDLVTVADHLVPADLGITTAVRQHLLFDLTKAEQMLAWTHADPADGIRRSVRWHLEHPPEHSDPDFSADDLALAAADAEAATDSR